MNKHVEIMIFCEFKKEMMIRSVAMEGGKAEDTEQNHMKIISDYKFTRRSKNNKKNRNTKKNKKQKKLSEIDHFRERMNMPIGTSSLSFPLTEDEIKENERIARQYHL